MTGNRQIKFEDTSDYIDKSVSFWDVQPMVEKIGPIIPRATPWEPSKNTPPNFTRSPRSSANQDSDTAASSGDAGGNSMDSKTERFLWILAGTLAITILVICQRDYVINGRVEHIKNDVEFRGKENESIKEEMRKGMDGLVKLFSAQQQTNNLLTQNLLESKETVSAIDKKISVLGARTEIITESANNFDRMAQSMSELLRSSYPKEQPKRTIQDDVPPKRTVQEHPESDVNTPRVTAKNVTILPPEEPKIGPIELTPTLAIDGIEISLPPEKSKRKFHFWNPFSWWRTEKPKFVNRPNEQ